jgi:hypothetical protein
LVLVVWICGGFDPVPAPVAGSWPVRQPRADQTVKSESKESSVVTPAMALRLIMLGQSGSFSLPGIAEPAVEPAASASTRDDAAVIGVVVNGRARAYCISEMHNPLTHVINDIIDRVPVTVTFCNRSGCGRVFTKPDALGRPLDVGVGGLVDGQLLLHVDHRNFSLDSAEIPLQDLEFETMTWAKWKAAHPGTDVCTRLDPVGFAQGPPGPRDTSGRDGAAGHVGE